MSLEESMYVVIIDVVLDVVFIIFIGDMIDYVIWNIFWVYNEVESMFFNIFLSFLEFGDIDRVLVKC